MKNTMKKTADLRRKKFLLQFRRYLEKYLKRPGTLNDGKKSETADASGTT